MKWVNTYILAALILVSAPNVVEALLLLVSVRPVYGACDYASLTTDLNTCMVTASGAADTKWGFPFGTIAEQATLCTTTNQATLKTCIEALFTSCNANAKSVNMFGTDGANLVTAYANVCNNTLVTDAHACMSSTTVATYTAAETTFTTAVDNLNTAATNIEICGLATTLKFTGYTELLTVTCTTATHLAVWSSFYDTVLDTYLCPTCSTNCAPATSTYIAMFTLITALLLVLLSRALESRGM